MSKHAVIIYYLLLVLGLVGFGFGFAAHNLVIPSIAVVLMIAVRVWSWQMNKTKGPLGSLYTDSVTTLLGGKIWLAIALVIVLPVVAYWITKLHLNWVLCVLGPAGGC
jgi:hypothetical protein